MKTRSWLSPITSKVLRACLTILMVAFWTACTDENVIGPDDDASSAKTVVANTVTGSSSADGLTYTFNIGTPKGGRAPSHFLFQFTDCDGNYLSGTYIESVTVNGNAWSITNTTGQGTGCSVGNDEAYVKLDNLDVLGAGVNNITVVVTLNKPAITGSLIVKSSTNCGAVFTVTSTYNCSTLCRTETAWAAGTRYTIRGNWGTFTPYSGAATSVTLWAGQNNDAGTVSFSEVVDGKVTISIVFNPGWGLDPARTESVKIQGYVTAPSGNPSPGLFTTYKGTSLSVEVAASNSLGVAFNFYGVHLDVKQCN